MKDQILPNLGQYHRKERELQPILMQLQSRSASPEDMEAIETMERIDQAQWQIARQAVKKARKNMAKKS